MSSNLLLQKTRTIEALPRTSKSQYNYNEGIDFSVRLDPKYEIVPGSFGLTANLVCTNGAAQLDPEVASKVYYNNFAGFSSMIRFISTMIDGSTKEEILNYGRYMRLKNQLTKDPANLSFNLEDYSQGVLTSHYQTKVIIAGRNGTADYPFLLKPHICVNRASRAFSRQDIGEEILIHINLAEPRDVFFGDDSANMDYFLTDLRMLYQIRPLQPTTSGVLTMGTVRHGTFDLTSSSSSVESIINIPCSSITSYFTYSPNLVRLSATSTNPNDAHSLASNYINLDEISWSFNDQNNTLYTYKLQTEEEYAMALKRSLSMNNNDLTDIRLTNFISAKEYQFSTFGVGINFEQIMPVGTKIEMNVKVSSDETLQPTQTLPWTVNLFYQGTIQN